MASPFSWPVLVPSALRAPVPINLGVRLPGGNVRDIDAIIAQLRLTHSDIFAAQLTVSHPGADDNGLWFFSHPATDIEVQLESSTGTCPFLSESSGSSDRFTAISVDQAIAFVVARLGISGPAA